MKEVRKELQEDIDNVRSDLKENISDIKIDIVRNLQLDNRVDKLYRFLENDRQLTTDRVGTA